MTLSPAPGGVVAWSWLDPSDAAVCERSLAELGALGTIATHDAPWLSIALSLGTGSPPGFAVPWASIALRLCERARVSPAAAGDVATAVSAVAADGVSGAPDALARCVLAARVLARHVDDAPARRVGDARLHRWLLCLGEASGASAPCNPPVAPAGAGAAVIPGAATPVGAREAIALWTASALVAGEEIAPFARFGRSVAEPLWLVDALVRLWLDPAAPDLAGPALTPLFALWLRDAALVPRLLRALAGERDSPARRFEIHSLLATRPYRAALSARASGMLASAREALAGVLPARSAAQGALVEAGASFVDMLAERLRFFDELMSFRDLLSSSAPTYGASAAPPAPHDGALLAEARVDLEAAVEFLLETAPWSESWEVQRFGVRGSREKPVGQWFARAVILNALLAIGRDVRADAEALLAEIPAGELRYFGPFREIPPDADDLAIMLELAAATGAASERVETWIAVMLANVGEGGAVPTWFHRGPGGSTTPGAEWAGDDCSAVRINLLIGLLSFDAARFAELVDANARRVLAALGAQGIQGAFFYDDRSTELSFLRFARLYLERRAGGPLAAAVAEAALSIRGRALRAQRLDGGFGTPLRTAACLEGIAMFDAAEPLLLERGLRYLGEHQLVDGSWPAEPLFRVPMKHGRAGYHMGRALTTALCARAMAAASSRRHGGEGRLG